MARQTTITPDAALVRYLAQGPGRSLTRLHAELEHEGHSIHVKTVQRWSHQHGWQTYAKAHDARQRESQDTTVVSRAVAMEGRHAELGRELQRMALMWAVKLQEEGHPLTPTEVARWAEAGVRIERLAVGAATSRTEVNVQVWSQVLVAIGALFDQVVTPALPQAKRDLVARELAEGLNGIRDSSLALPEPDDD